MDEMSVGITVRLEVSCAPLYVAVIPTLASGYGSSVLTVNVWLLVPVGKKTDGGTETLVASLVDSATITPGEAAGAFSVSVPIVNEFAQAGSGLNVSDC